MSSTDLIINQDTMDFVTGMSQVQLQELEDAIYLWRLRAAAQQLEENGISIKSVIQTPSTSGSTCYIAAKKLLVYPPAGVTSTQPTAANLKLAEHLLRAIGSLGVLVGYDRWIKCLPLGDLAGFHSNGLSGLSIEEAGRRFSSGAYDAEEYRLAILAAQNLDPQHTDGDDGFDWLTIDEIAQRWGVSRRRAQAHVKRLHNTAGVGRRLLGSWVLTPAEVVAHKPADGPGRPRKLKQ